MLLSLDKQDRFEFGKNWDSFLQTLNTDRIRVAEDSLKDMLEVQNLNGKSFLDMGCGSGLFSLAAMRLGATRVHSFDYDQQSVNCAKYLREKFFEGHSNWTIERGDVLDQEYVRSLGSFDIIYSWGVLHHTGNMWKALSNAAIPVAEEGGRLFIAIYNDQGRWSKLWLKIKQTYCNLPRWAQPLFIIFILPKLEGPSMIRNLCHGKLPWAHWNEHYKSRGMSRWHDIKDWVGGLPFEVAKPEQIFDFYRSKGLTLDRLLTEGGGHGNNQFVFTRCD